MTASMNRGLRSTSGQSFNAACCMKRLHAEEKAPVRAGSSCSTHYGEALFFCLPHAISLLLTTLFYFSVVKVLIPYAAVSHGLCQRGTYQNRFVSRAYYYFDQGHMHDRFLGQSSTVEPLGRFSSKLPGGHIHTNACCCRKVNFRILPFLNNCNHCLRNDSGMVMLALIFRNVHPASSRC